MTQTLFIERLQRLDDGWAWVAEQEDFDLEADFGIDEMNVTGEICKIGQLLVRYGTIAGEVSANRDRKEEERRLVRAQLDGAIRSDAELSGTKLSEGRIKEQIVASTAYQNALAPLHILRADAVKTEHWWRSIVKKADLLNALAFRQNAEIRKAY